MIPYNFPDKEEPINSLVRKVAEDEKLPMFDVHTRYEAELAHGPNMLNYRRLPLKSLPESLHEFAKPFNKVGYVEVMDNQLDAHFRDVPGWFGDRHPNHAGYHVIGDETAKFLIKLIRSKGK